ncbi:trk system potassium uptake protein TrkA [Prosthecobacter debontii]|uniref:Trk system potassium uptake protein TrkA n=1 Tax=Prosthecobacter debontii TaxID=48467 RepID=A0A1T4Z035_9BACT|nr:TrkA family potassium uptake protein [Prosthecobacter debontii]SKB06921.1 trk system potassium uptake protein TrkA [Prosthecobacter debontii]
MRFCIIGLGTFGTHLARHLIRDGHEVIGVDNDPAHIEAMKDEVEFLLTADCSDINVFKDIPVSDCDAIILAVGKDFEAALSIAANVQQVGAKRIISRIINPLHARLLKLLKIDELLIPEAMAAAWLARTLKTPDVRNSLAVGKGHEIAEVKVPVGLIGKTLQEAGLRSRYDLNLVTVLRHKPISGFTGSAPVVDKIIGVPDPTRIFEEGDILLLFGTEKNLRRLLDDHCEE